MNKFEFINKLKNLSYENNMGFFSERKFEKDKQKLLEFISCHNMNFSVNGITPLLAICMNTTLNKELFSKIFEQTTCSEIFQQYNGKNALYYAIENKHFDYIKILLKYPELIEFNNYTELCNKKLDSMQINYINFALINKTAADFLYSLYLDVKNNDVSKVKTTLPSYEKDFYYNLIKNKNAFLDLIITEDVSSVEMLKVFDEYLNIKDTKFLAYDNEPMTFFEYFSLIENYLKKINPDSEECLKLQNFVEYFNQTKSIKQPEFNL